MSNNNENQSFKAHFTTHKIAYVILFLSSILLYVNTLSNEYALDDQLAIYENTFVTKGISGIPEILTTDAFVGFFGDRGSKLISGGRYRPLSFVTFAIEWELFSKSPMGNHLVNIILFGIMVCGIFYFLSLLFPMNDDNSIYFSIQFIASLLYVFHPIHTEVVANIKGRDEILCFLFSILTMIFFMRNVFEEKWKNFLLVSILFFLALMSKENAITFIGIFALIVVFKEGIKGIVTSIQKFGPIISAAAVFLFLRTKYTASGVMDTSTEILNNPFVNATTSQKWGTVFYSYIKYYWLLIFPKNLTHDYYFNQIPLQDLSSPFVVLSIIIIITIILYCLKTKWQGNKIFFAIAFYFITFSIVSNFFFTVGIIMNERFVFISSLGFSILCAVVFQKIHQKSDKRLVLTLLGILLVLYSYKTYSRNQDWKNNYTLFSADYKTSYNSAKVATSLGGSLLDYSNTLTDSAKKREILDSSIRVLAHSVSIYPENSQALLLYGNAIYSRNKNPEEAKAIYKQCLIYRPNGFFDGEYNLGIVYYNTSNMDSALYYIQRAHDLRPENQEVKNLLSTILAKSGKTNEAILLAGNDINNIATLALNAKEGGNIPEALSLAEKALAINPENPIANYVKGICLSRFMNRLDEGIPYLEKGINKTTSNPNWLEDLAVAYGMSGRIKETIPILEEVIRLQPNNKEPYLNIATSYARLGNQQKAQYYMNIANTK